MTTTPELQQAVTAMRRLQFEAAQELLTKVLSGQPNNTQARWLLVQSLEARHQSDEAQEQLNKLLVHCKKDLAAIDHVAGHMRERGYPLAHVLRAYKKYLDSQPASAVAAFNYAYNLSRDGQFEKAIETYLHALTLGIDRPEEVHLNIANICMDFLHDHARAKQHLGESLALNPAYSSAYYNLGNLAEQEGGRDEAESNFKRCLELDRGNESALARLADTRQFTDADDPLFVQMVARARNSNNADLHFAVGKAYEQLRHFDEAWEHFTKGNTLDRQLMPAYDPARTEAWFERIKALCDPDWLSRFTGDSHEVVFVCGMFRSGSTLLEQMLAAHPGFQAGGEQEFFPRLIAAEFPHYPDGLDSLAAGDLHTWRQHHHDQLAGRFPEGVIVTDKRPDNFLYLGLIKAILPAAKFVVTDRDWRDVATSVYSVRLGPTQHYATRLPDIRHYASLHDDLIEHWQQLFGEDLVRIRYDELVRRPEPTLGALLERLGETWDASCLEFHGLQNSVKTASVWQVRQPLHDKSVGRWKNYQRQFEADLGANLEA